MEVVGNFTACVLIAIQHARRLEHVGLPAIVAHIRNARQISYLDTNANINYLAQQESAYRRRMDNIHYGRISGGMNHIGAI